MRLPASVTLQTLSLILMAGTSATAVVPIPPNVPVTGHLPGLQNEEQVWICPTDTNVVITNHRDFRLGYRQIGIGRSTDGGATWVDTLLSPAFQLEQYQSDPTMTVNSSGTYYMCDLDYIPTSTYTDPSWVVFYASTNKGATWTGPFTVETTTGPYFEDKQFITCDRSGGAHDGNVYVSWTRFAWPTRIMFARSTNGAVSFDDTLIVGSVHYVSCYGQFLDAGQFSQPLVGKDGAVYVFWQGYDIDSSGGSCDLYMALRSNKSTDGGQNWQGERLLGRVDGWNYVDGSVDVYSQPTTEADLTGGPHAGNLYLQYRDTVSAPGWQSDILFRRSLDTGHTWSPPIRVNDDPQGVDADQFHNWMVCNDEGVLVSIWYDQRTDPAHYNFDVFAGYSYDGGATWTSNHRVSSVSISPSFLLQGTTSASAIQTSEPNRLPLEAMMPMAGKIAEYIGVSCVHDKVVAVWTDTRDATGPGQQDVYSARWYLPLTDPRLIYPLNGETVGLTPGLLWATAWKENQDMYRLQIASSPGFSTVLRDLMLTTAAYNDSLNGLADGVYYWRIKAYRAPGGTPVDSTSFSSPGSFHLQRPATCDCSCHADPICDQAADVFDVVNAIDVIFSGAVNTIDPQCPHVGRVDYNCDCVLDVFDVIYAIDYVFSGGAAPCNPCAPGGQCP